MIQPKVAVNGPELRSNVSRGEPKLLIFIAAVVTNVLPHVDVLLTAARNVIYLLSRDYFCIGKP